MDETLAKVQNKHKIQTIEEAKKGATVEELVDEEEDAPPLETVDMEELAKNKEL